MDQSFEIEVEFDRNHKCVIPADDYKEMEYVVMDKIFCCRSIKITRCVDGEKKLFKYIEIM